MITLLLLIIAVAEITRIIMTHKPLNKKTHFKNKLQGVEQMIWDIEFKRFKTQEIREEVRKEYDILQSKIAAVETQMNNFQGEEADKAKLQDTKIVLERDRDRFLAQIKQIDIEINGAKKSEEYPDGATGIVHQIDSLHELKGMLKDWMSKIK